MTLTDSGHLHFYTFQVDHRGRNACRVPFSPLRQISRNFCSLRNQGKVALRWILRVRRGLNWLVIVVEGVAENENTAVTLRVQLRIIRWYGLGSPVGIATELQAGRFGIESRWGRDFTPVQTGPGAHPTSYKMGTGSFPGVKCGRGVLLTTHPLLVPRSWKSRAIPLPTFWITPGL